MILIAWLVCLSAGVSKNLSLASALYRRASELESVYSSYGMSWATTMGIAPRLAGAYVTLERWMEALGQQYHDTDLKETMENLEEATGVSIYYFITLGLGLGSVLFYIWVVM
jgi:hypothetical protein